MRERERERDGSINRALLYSQHFEKQETIKCERGQLNGTGLQAA